MTLMRVKSEVVRSSRFIRGRRRCHWLHRLGQGGTHGASWQPREVGHKWADLRQLGTPRNMQPTASPRQANSFARAVLGNGYQRQDLARQSGSGGIVGHDRVSDVDSEAERLDRRGEVGVHRVDHEVGREVGVDPGDPEGARLVPERHKHPVGRPLEGLAADDPGNRDDPDAALAGAH